MTMYPPSSSREAPAPHTGEGSLTWRDVWRVSWRRGLARAGLLALFGIGVTLLATNPAEWAASWGGLTDHVRTMTIVIGPLAASLACWEAGRDRRRGLEEMLGTVPRAQWRRDLMKYSVVALAVVAAYVMTFGIGAAMVAPAATYAGGRWWASLAVGALGLLAFSAIGWAVGRRVTSSLAAPILGVACYIGAGASMYFSGGWVQLVPLAHGAPGSRMQVTAIAGASLFYLMVIAAVLAGVMTRRRWLAALPLVLAILLAVPLASGGRTSWLETDPEAQRSACTNDGRVCLWRTHAGLLEDVAAVAHPLLDAITVDSGPQYRLEELPRTIRGEPPVASPAAVDVIPISLNKRASVSGRGLTSPEIVTNAVRDLAFPRCTEMEEELEMVPYVVADLLASTSSTVPDGAGAERGSDVHHLLDRYQNASPRDRSTWLNDWIRAAHACDTAALKSLISEGAP